jgi:hypothetical protein
MYKNFILGTNVYTNKPSGETDNSFRNHKTYKDGEVISSPLYVGYKNGGVMTRIGIDAPFVQDATQNLWHKLIGSPYFRTPYEKKVMPYYYTGYYNPFSLY